MKSSVKNTLWLSALIIFLLPFRQMNLAQAQNLYFPPLSGNDWETTAPADLGWCPDEIPSLLTYMEDKNTNAFIVLKDGKIVIEEYFNGFHRDTFFQWNSAGKTMTAFAIGLAQQNGLLNLDDKTSDYLGVGWTALPKEKEDLITIRHQLTMTSGLDDSGDPFCTDPACLTYEADAGSRWAYHNGPYTLLTDVVEAATGLRINTFLRQEVLTKTGIWGEFVPIDFNKILFSTPRNMARFGLLNLNKGTWDTTPVLEDMDFFEQMTTRSQEINKGYGYLWWLNDTDEYMLPGLQIKVRRNPVPDAPRDMISGIGLNGQFVSAVPSENLVVVRMGGAPDLRLVPLEFYNEMWQQLNEVICKSTSTGEIEKDEENVFPNPFSERIRFQNMMDEVRIFNNFGELIIQASRVSEVETGHLHKGIFFVETIDNQQVRKVAKVVKL